MKLKPLADRVVLKQNEAEEKTAGGIFLASAAQEKPEVYEVVEVGPGGMVDGNEVTRSRFVPAGGFVERPLRIPGAAVRERITVTLENDGPGMFTDYHVYITQ